MPLSLTQLCEILAKHGIQAAPEGDGQTLVSAVATLDEAVAGQISFLSNPKYEKLLPATRATAVVLKPGIDAPPHLQLVRAADPYAAITGMTVALHGYRRHRLPRLPDGESAPQVAASARIGENATIYPGVTIDEEVSIGQNAAIYPGCYIGPRCRIGDNVTLYPNVVIYEECILGNRVTIHAGTVIGNDGLGYAPLGQRWFKIPQIGIVEIGDDVEIGSNCSIDRATLGRTRIARGTKFSNLIAIGHGAHIGEDCMLVAQVGIAGSVTVGNHVQMAGQVGVVGHIKIGDNAQVGAKAGIVNDVDAGETVLGAPAAPIREERRRLIHIKHLPELNERVKQLEKKQAELLRQVAELRGRLQ